MARARSSGAALRRRIRPRSDSARRQHARRVGARADDMVAWRHQGELDQRKSHQGGRMVATVRKKAAMLRYKELEAKGKDWGLGVELL